MNTKYEKELEDLISNCKIHNAKITYANLEFGNYSCFDFKIVVEWGGFGCVISGTNLGHTGSLDGWEYGIEYIMRIINTVGADNLNDMVGKYVRIADKNGCFAAIGNITEDKWFSPEIFCKYKLEEEKEPVAINTTDEDGWEDSELKLENGFPSFCYAIIDSTEHLLAEYYSEDKSKVIKSVPIIDENTFVKCYKRWVEPKIDRGII